MIAVRALSIDHSNTNTAPRRDDKRTAGDYTQHFPPPWLDWPGDLNDYLFSLPTPPFISSSIQPLSVLLNAKQKRGDHLLFPRPPREVCERHLRYF